ncbi:hypothetical protein V8F06_013687, partial [Rhypophila decipiens]
MPGGIPVLVVIKGRPVDVPPLPEMGNLLEVSVSVHVVEIPGLLLVITLGGMLVDVTGGKLVGSSVEVSVEVPGVPGLLVVMLGGTAVDVSGRLVGTPLVVSVHVVEVAYELLLAETMGGGMLVADVMIEEKLLVETPQLDPGHVDVQVDQLRLVDPDQVVRDALEPWILGGTLLAGISDADVTGYVEVEMVQLPVPLVAPNDEVVTADGTLLVDTSGPEEVDTILVVDDVLISGGVEVSHEELV